MAEASHFLKSIRGRGKGLPPGFSYEHTPGQFGLDTLISQPQIDEARMMVVIPFADGKHRDGVGDLLEVGGIELSRHKVNPIALYDHGKSVTLPIGMAEDPDTRAYTVRIDQAARGADAPTFFYQGKGMSGVSREDEYHHAVFCGQLFDLMAQRYVRGGSIGYTVIAARELPADYESGTPKGLHLLSVKMLELSAVVLPANQDTVAKSLADYRAKLSDTARQILSMRLVMGKPLSSHLVKSLTPFVQDTRTFTGYRGKAVSPDDRAVRDTLIDSLKNVLKEVEVGPDYQRLFWHPGEQCAWWESFDGDDENQVRRIAETLEKVPGVKKVRVESESSPKGTGWVQLYPVPKYATKALPPSPIPSSRKALAAIRKKYRPVKRLRRTLKKGVPGSAVLYVSKKDLETVKSKAHGMGMKLTWLADSPHGVKVKLTGTDEGIDSLARDYAIPVAKRMRTKAMPEDDKAFMGVGDTTVVGRRVGGRGSRARRNRQVLDTVNSAGSSGQPRAGAGAGPDPAPAPASVAPPRKPGSTDPKPVRSVAHTDPPRAGGSDPAPAGVRREDKSMENPMEDPGIDKITDQGDRDGTGSDINEEPYEAQVYRRMHEDHSLLMHDYDDLMKRSVHEPTRNRLTAQLEHHAQHLDELEKEFPEHFPDLPGLSEADEDAETEGGESLDDADEVTDAPAESPDELEAEESAPPDDAATPSSSGNREEEEPSPEEAFEASTKSLREKYKKGAKCSSCSGKEKKIKGKRGKEFNSPEHQRMRRENVRADSRARAAGRAPIPSHAPIEGEEHPPTSGGPIGSHAPDDDHGGAPIPRRKALQDHETGPYGEAADFLGQLSQPDSLFDEEERMKSYHYHKTLEGMADLEDVAEDDELDGDTEAGEMDRADVGGQGEYREKAQVNPVNRPVSPETIKRDRDVEHKLPGRIRQYGERMQNRPGDKPAADAQHSQTGQKSVRGVARDASRFMGRLYKEMNFGDPHREECGMHAASMKEFMPDPDSESAPEGDETAQDAPGDMIDQDDQDAIDQMGTDGAGQEEPSDEEMKALSKVLTEQAKQIKELTRTVAPLINAYRRP